MAQDPEYSELLIVGMNLCVGVTQRATPTHKFIHRLSNAEYSFDVLLMSRVKYLSLTHLGYDNRALSVLLDGCLAPLKPRARMIASTKADIAPGAMKAQPLRSQGDKTLLHSIVLYSSL
jgi:hypothetical protein